MRILDNERDSARNKIVLYLTKGEARELRDSLAALIGRDRAGDHEHVSSSDFSKEVTICLYDPDTPSSWERFNDRSRKLIANDV